MILTALSNLSKTVRNILKPSHSPKQVLDSHQMLLMILTALSILSKTANISPQLLLSLLEISHYGVSLYQHVVHFLEQPGSSLGLFQVLSATAFSNLLHLPQIILIVHHLLLQIAEHLMLPNELVSFLQSDSLNS